MRLVLAAIMIVLASADASAYTFALSKEQRAKMARYCFDGFDGCMRRGAARGVSARQDKLEKICAMACRMRSMQH